MKAENNIKETTDLEAVEDMGTNVEKTCEGVVAAVHQVT